MTYTEKKAADAASALGMVGDRNARDLLEQLVNEVIEDCAKGSVGSPAETNCERCGFVHRPRKNCKIALTGRVDE